jgi:hypothetical protein
VRWEGLFEDLEAQLAAQDAGSLAARVSELTRLERSRVSLVDRLLGWVGQSVVAHLVSGQPVDGGLVDVGPDWLLVDCHGLVLVPTSALTSLSGLGAAASAPGQDGVRRRYRLPAVLRAVARDRSPVRLRLVDGTSLTGTIDAVGADHLDLAEHPADELRRARAVLGVRTVMFQALVTVRPAHGTTSLA